jgi:hypothetical protein
MSSEIRTDLIKDKSNTKTLATLSSSAVTLHSDVTFPSGHIVQTKFVSFDDVQTIGNGSSGGSTFTNIGSGVSGKEFSIAMAVSSGNKIYGSGCVNINANNRYSALKIFADSTQIAMGLASGSRTQVTASSTENPDVSYSNLYMHQVSFAFTHTPSDTNSHAYTIKGGNVYSDAKITYINRTTSDGDSTIGVRGYSHFILMEIAQ